MEINSTYRAITKAGFNQVNFPKLRDVMFITESEAAAHYVARFYRDERGQQILKVCGLILVAHIVNQNRRITNISYSVMLAVARWYVKGLRDTGKV
jgi:hypothetical protein